MNINKITNQAMDLYSKLFSGVSHMISKITRKRWNAKEGYLLPHSLFSRLQTRFTSIKEHIQRLEGLKYEPPIGNTGTILVATEDDTLKKLIRLLLNEDMGCSVVVTSSGLEAVLKTREIRPNILIADVDLSDGDGYKVSSEIKNDPLFKNTFVLLLSSDSTYDIKKTEESKADDVIIKTKDIRDIIPDILDRLKIAIRPKKVDIKRPVSRVVMLLIVLFVVITMLYPRFNKNQRSAESDSIQKTGNGMSVAVTVGDDGEVFIEFPEKKKYSLQELQGEIQKLVNNLGQEMKDRSVPPRPDPNAAYSTKMDGMNKKREVEEKPPRRATEQTASSGLENERRKEYRRKIKASHAEDKTSSEDLEKIETLKVEVLKLSKLRSKEEKMSILEKTQGEKNVPVKEKLKPTESTSIVALKETVKENKRSGFAEQLKPPTNERKKPSRKLNNVRVRNDPTKFNNPTNERLNGDKYVIKRGDTLYSIAKAFSTSVTELKIVNNLKSDKILIGRDLIIPTQVNAEAKKVLITSPKKSESKKVKIVNWSYSTVLGGLAIHHITIDNPTDIAYKNVKVKMHYHSDPREQVNDEQQILLSETIPPRSRLTLVKEVSTIGKGQGVGNASDAEVLEATPVGN